MNSKLIVTIDGLILAVATAVQTSGLTGLSISAAVKGDITFVLMLIIVAAKYVQGAMAPSTH